MAAAPTAAILDLPHELLDKVFGYLAWSPLQSLTPSSSDITNISLSCRSLREAILPTLFRNVRLKLRWVDGAIVEPGLYRLRREAPHLAKLVRCVHVQTEYGKFDDRRLRPFTVPQALGDWTTPATVREEGSALETAHRKRILEIADGLYGDEDPDPPTPMHGEIERLARAFFNQPDHYNERVDADGSIPPRQASLGGNALHSSRGAEVGLSALALKAKHNARKERLALDALIVCMVCLPPQMTTLIFEAVPIDMHDQLQHVFALGVCSLAMKIFADRLQDMKMISRSLDAGRRLHAPNDPAVNDDYIATLSPVVPTLRSITSLTLASTTGISDRLSRHNLDAIRATEWRVEPLTTNITHLSLRNITDNRSNFFNFIKSFPSLTDLTMSGLKLGPDMGTGFVRQQHRTSDDPLWLLFLISIRLQRRDLHLHLGNLLQWHAPDTLPASAVRWLAEEAVPVGAKVDFERETRLTEDFGSFMVSLWTVDDGERGDVARQDPGLGRLVDDAFNTRGHTFANLR